ncbi:MAG TPA: DUF924 family protein [Alphaproteobacteria bacterium]|nr:DUF924 family protein [Alphaproteobacteria bacterium]
MPDPSDIIDFWFAEGAEEKWFHPPPEFDAAIVERFSAAYEDAAAGRLAGWEATPEGALALVIMLDQFPRNMFRESAQAFAADALARAVAERAIAAGHDLAVPVERRVFFYMPFEHAEDLALQDRCCALVRERCDLGGYVDFADRHRAVIARFGRFPHRNTVLGRESTPEEIEYLESRDTPF